MKFDYSAPIDGLVRRSLRELFTALLESWTCRRAGREGRRSSEEVAQGEVKSVLRTIRAPSVAIREPRNGAHLARLRE